jgi:hypothetical protein
MNNSEHYRNQVRLLVECLPSIDDEKCFALKGGTAINLFIRNFPRLSVDIDLAYVAVQDRKSTLEEISGALQRIVHRLNVAGFRAQMQESNGPDVRIFVRNKQGVNIKIEVNHVWRGLLNPPVQRDVQDDVADQFGFAQISVVSMPDLYGGKICAAMDRQHPRDIFDVKLLLEDSGITSEIYYGFLAYMLGHTRPMAEVLQPNWKNLRQPFENEFEGMTTVPVTHEELNAVPPALMAALKKHFTAQDHRFLLSYEQGQPDWLLFPHDLSAFPAICWKQQNLLKLKLQDREKWERAIEKLRGVLDSWVNSK